MMLFGIQNTVVHGGAPAVAAAPVEQNGSAGDGSLASLLAGIPGAQGGMGALDIGFILSRLKQEQSLSEKHEQMTAALPQDVRQRVTEMCKEFEGLSASLRLEWCFGVLATSVQKLVTQCLGSNHELLLKELNTLFDKFHASLEDGTFAEEMIPVSTFGENPLFQLLGGMMGGTSATVKKKFDKELLTKLHVVLDIILQAYDAQGKAAHSALATQTKVFRDLIIYAEKKDISSLCATCIRLLDKQCNSVRGHLKETIEILIRARVAMAVGADAQQAEALNYWIKYLAEYESTLASFMSLTKYSFDVGWLLRLMSRAYEVAEPLAYVQLVSGTLGKASDLRKAFGVQAAIRTVVLALATTYYYEKNTGEQAQQYVIGGSTLQQKADAAARHGSSGPGHAGLLVDAVGKSKDALLSPTMFVEPLHPAKMAIIRLLLALGHYKINNWDKDFNPSNDAGVKFVLSIITHTAYEGLGAYCQYAARKHLPPAFLTTLEKYSAGLVKPELLPVITRIAVPFILLHEKCRSTVDRVVKFSESDLIMYYPSFYLWIDAARFGKWTWSCIPWVPQPKDQSDADEYKKIYKMGFYIEYMLMHYVLESLGAFGGKLAIKAYQKWFARDDAQAGSMAQMFNEYKGYAAMLFMPGPANEIRATVIEFLINSGHLKRENIKDVNLVNRCLFEEMLHYVVQFNFLTHDQAAIFLDRFVELQSKPDHYADIVKLINDVADQAASSFLVETGGNIGGFIGGMTANIAMWWKGPFFLKPPPIINQSFNERQAEVPAMVDGNQ
jgi:hypothetical protein